MVHNSQHDVHGALSARHNPTPSPNCPSGWRLAPSPLISQWRRTFAIFKMAARLFGACRHFENSAQTRVAIFFVADAGFPGRVIFQFLVTTCRSGTLPFEFWRHDCCHFFNGGLWVRHQCRGVISPPRRKWRHCKRANSKMAQMHRHFLGGDEDVATW